MKDEKLSEERSRERVKIFQEPVKPGLVDFEEAMP